MGGREIYTTSGDASNDVDADVRYEALKCLTKAGRAFTLDNAKNILIKPVLTGLLPSGLQKDAAGEALFKHFQREFVKNLPETQLESDADSEFSNQNAFFALVLKDYAKRKSDLQAAIQDDFAERYTLILNGIVKSIGASELTERIRAHGKSLCKDYTRQGLDIICEKQDIEDLPFVRSILNKGAVSHSAVDFRYLGKHGQWRDIQLIINLLSTTYENKNTLSLMAISDLSIVEEATHAILKLGKQRASDLIGLAMPHDLLASLVAKIPDRIFLDLTDAQIKPLVYFENDVVRKNAAQKYIRVFNKKRIKGTSKNKRFPVLLRT